MLNASSKEVRLPYLRKSSHRCVGVLMAGERTYPAFRALCEVLRQPGRTIEIAARFAEGRHERLPQLALEVAALRPDVILAVGAVSFYAVRAIAPSAPVVFAVVLNPEAAGIGDWCDIL
jgi:putative tryptophan/tyrosine transport system substrate-binding protein